MSFHRNVDVRVWGDTKFRALAAPPPNPRYLWLHLLTGQHTGPVPGLSSIGRAALAEELEWEPSDVDEMFEELESRGMAKADWKAKVIWLPNAINHNEPASPNQVKSWLRWIDGVPECDLRNEAIAGIYRYLRRRDASRDPEEAKSSFAEPLARWLTGRPALKNLLEQHGEKGTDTASSGARSAASGTIPDTVSGTVPDTVSGTVPAGYPKQERERDPYSDPESETEREPDGGTGAPLAAGAAGPSASLRVVNPDPGTEARGTEPPRGDPKHPKRTSRAKDQASELGAKVLEEINRHRRRVVPGATGFKRDPALEARIAEGVEEADLLLVVEHQWTREFMRCNQARYFRPKTLFGSENFSGYLVEAQAWDAAGRPPEEPRQKPGWSPPAPTRNPYRQAEIL